MQKERIQGSENNRMPNALANSGLVTKESLSELLRTISQRRRNGWLEIQYPDQQVNLGFMQGKICEVQHNSQSSIEEFAKRLELAGYTVERSKIGWNDSYSSLFVAVNDGAHISQKLSIEEAKYKEFLKHRILDSLYELLEQAGGTYEFRNGLVEIDSEFSPSIPVGQLLLDLVALSTDESGFKEKVGSKNWVERIGTDVPNGLSEEEASLLSLVSPTGVKVTHLKELSLLSKYHFESAFSHLLAQGLVRLSNAQVSATTTLFGDEIVSALEDSIDLAFSTSTQEPLDMLYEEHQEILNKARAYEKHSKAEAKIISLSEKSATPQIPADRIEAESTEISARQEINTSLSILSFKLLTIESVPHLIVLLYLIMALALPVIFWSAAFKVFSH